MREDALETQLNTQKARADLLQIEVDDSREKLALVTAAKVSLETQLEQTRLDLRESRQNEQRTQDWCDELDAKRQMDRYEIERFKMERNGFEIQANINLERAQSAEKKLADAEFEFARQKAELETVSA